MTHSRRRRSAVIRNGLRGAVAGGFLSGIPSTAYSIATGGDALEPAVAAGSILLPHEKRRAVLLLAAIPVHAALSVTWAVVFAAVLPRQNPVREGTIAGIAVAALDLGIFGRAFPRIQALPPIPQIADHIVFGIITALTLAHETRTTGDDSDTHAERHAEVCSE